MAVTAEAMGTVVTEQLDAVLTVDGSEHGGNLVTQDSCQRPRAAVDRGDADAHLAQ